MAFLFLYKVAPRPEKNNGMLYAKQNTKKARCRFFPPFSPIFLHARKPKRSDTVFVSKSDVYLRNSQCCIVNITSHAVYAYALLSIFKKELLADTTFRPRINVDAASRMAVSKLKIVSDPDSYVATVEVSCAAVFHQVTMLTAPRI